MDKESYFVQEYLNCCFNCKFFHEVVCHLAACVEKQDDTKPAHPLGICRGYKRKI